MKKSWLIVGIILVVATVGGIYVFGSNKKESSEPTTTDLNLDQQPSSAAVTTSQYIEYSPSVIASTPGTKILFFHALWCPQCRDLEKSIKAGSIPEGTTIIKVDYDTNQALRQKYGVTLQTTLVKVDDNGNLIEKYVAYDEPTLQSLIDNLL